MNDTKGKLGKKNRGNSWRGKDGDLRQQFMTHADEEHDSRAGPRHQLYYILTRIAHSTSTWTPRNQRLAVHWKSMSASADTSGPYDSFTLFLDFWRKKNRDKIITLPVHTSIHSQHSRDSRITRIARTGLFQKRTRKKSRLKLYSLGWF